MDQMARPDHVARARDLGPLVAASADAIERDRRLPPPLLSALHDAGLFRMLLPRSAGGDELEAGAYLRAVIEVSRHDGSVGWCLFQANSTALIAAYLPQEVAREIYADQVTAIAWGPPNDSRARAVPGGYRVGGRWRFASGCHHATWMGAHCNVEEPNGSLRLTASGRPAWRTLLFPAREARLIDDWDVIGLRGTGSDSYAVADLFVPEPFSSSREDPSLRRERGGLYAFTMQGLYTVGSAGVALGLAGAMLDGFAQLAAHKAPRGIGARLADNAAVQSGLAQAEANLGAARAYLLATLAEVGAEVDPVALIDISARARVRLAATYAIQAAIETADYAYRAAGSDAIFAGSAFERRFRDIHTLSQQTQARMANFEDVGQVMLGVERPGDFY